MFDTISFSSVDSGVIAAVGTSVVDLGIAAVSAAVVEVVDSGVAVVGAMVIETLDSGVGTTLVEVVDSGVIVEVTIKYINVVAWVSVLNTSSLVVDRVSVSAVTVVERSLSSGLCSGLWSLLGNIGGNL